MFILKYLHGPNLVWRLVDCTVVLRYYFQRLCWVILINTVNSVSYEQLLFLTMRNCHSNDYNSYTMKKRTVPLFTNYCIIMSVIIQIRWCLSVIESRKNYWTDLSEGFAASILRRKHVHVYFVLKFSLFQGDDIDYPL